MGGNDQSHQLQLGLQAEDDLKSRGFTASCGPTGGVLIERGGHARGVWHFSGAAFYWTPAGWREPIHRVDGVEAAIDYTVSAIAGV